ncbi:MULTISPECIES: hypothetical protein [Burkholderia]|nr:MULTISPECIES: hypothetical protein [Burkholderia]
MSMNGEREGAGRRAFETELTQTPALRQELEEWRLLGQARQLKYNESVRTKRDNAFLQVLGRFAQDLNAKPSHLAGPNNSVWRRLWKWIWPGPVSPLLPLGWALAAAMSMLALQWRTVGVESTLLATRGGENLCPRLSISLPDAVTAKRLRDVLAQYNVHLISGPDDDGRFVLSAPRSSSLYDAARVLDVASATQLPDAVCPRP